MAHDRNSSEEKELGLIDKLELRIALADSEPKLQSLLNTFLCPLLLKLLSPHQRVRDKVIGICHHINARVKDPSVQLPVLDLLKQFKEHSSPLLRHFNLRYISQGFERAPESYHRRILPVLLPGISDNFEESSANASSLFYLFLRVLHHLKLPPRESEESSNLRQQVGLSNPKDAQFLSTWIGKLFLFNRSPNSFQNPGLRPSDCQFLQVNGDIPSWDPSSGGLALTDTKVVALKFIESGAFNDAERLLPALFAAADTNSRLSSQGDDILKRTISEIPLEDERLVERLFTLYLGQQGSDGSYPVRLPLQGKILSLLSRSKVAANYKAEILRVVEMSLEVSDSHLEASNPRKRGLEASKLRVQLFSFIHWFTQNASNEALEDIAVAIIRILRLYIGHQGWPRNKSDIKEPLEIASRNYCYESIGLIAKSCPDLLLQPDLELLHWLFQSLASDDWGTETAISIEQSLASIISVFSTDLTEELLSQLVKLLLRYTEVELGNKDLSGHEIIRTTRYIALRFANRCLPFDNSLARYINVLALNGYSSSRKEIIDEATRGLEPYWHQNMNIYETFPTHTQSTRYSSTRLPEADELIDTIFMGDGPGLSPFALQAAVVFCQAILFNEALVKSDRSPLVDAEWTRNLNALVANDEFSQSCIKQYLLRYSGSHNIRLKKLFEATFKAFTNPAAPDPVKTGECLLNLVSLGPAGLLSDSECNHTQLVPLIHSNNSARVAACHLFGLVVNYKASPSEDLFDSVLEMFTAKAQSWKTATGQAAVESYGSLIALSYVISRRRLSAERYPAIDNKIPQIVDSILNMLCESHNKDTIHIALTCIEQLLISEALTACEIPEELNLFGRLQGLSKEGYEKAILALGYMAMQFPESSEPDSMIMKTLTGLYDLHELRQPELHFAVGSALSSIALGWASKSMLGLWEGTSSLQNTESLNRDFLNTILERVIQFCAQTKPSLRQASVIWLLCLTKYCGHFSGIQSRLRILQRVFKGFLADRESLNQESASRGLTLIYEIGGQEIKDELVKDLVGSFTSSSSNLAGNVAEDTQLFDAGALPTSGNSSVTTYKDIVQLSNEVGDPSLIYRFMSLASSSSIWSSRAAFGRFGLSKILSDSSVDGYLSRNPKLFPVLYRYRFDPNTNVRRSMNDIWTSLVDDTQATVKLHLPAIIKDLLKNALAKEWRTREACCAGLAELLQGMLFVDYEPYFTDLWAIAFKVSDDIKDTVRKAAMALAKVLTGNIMRSLDGGTSSQAVHQMLGKLLPFLLSSAGIESSAAEVRAFALTTLLDIIKKGNSGFLGPFLGEIVGDRLLPSLSSLEPEAINYVHLNAEKYGMTEQQIDDARLSKIRTSPITESIERCLDMLDDRSMEDLAPRLSNAVRTVLGLPSKVGISRTLVTLSTRRNAIFKPYADQFLKMQRRQVVDRNDTISAAATTSCGYICRLSSDPEILSHIAYAEKLYFEFDDERSRAISGELMLAIAKYATERYQNLYSSTLPFVFIGMHDTNGLIEDIFKQAWEEGLGGARMAKLYLVEISQLVEKQLDSARWPVKHASSLAISKIVHFLGRDISFQESKIIWPLLEKALKSKTWNGKENVLGAFISFLRNSKYVHDNELIAARCKAIIIRECKRNNDGIYRQQALAALGDFVEIFPADEWFEEVHGLITPVLKTLLGSNASNMEIDTDSHSGSRTTILEETIGNAIRTLLKSVNPSVSEHNKLQEDLSSCLKHVHEVRSHTSSLVQSGIMDGESALFEKLEGRNSSHSIIYTEILGDFLKTLELHDSAPEHLRIKAAENVVRFASIAKSNESLRRITWSLLDSKASDRSKSVQDALMKAREALE